MKLRKHYILLVLAFFTGFVVSQAQHKSFFATQTEGCYPMQVSFGTHIEGVASYLWDLGDGTTSVLPDPTVLYKYPGTYDVSLFITYANGTTEMLVEKQFIRVIEKSIPDFEIVEGSSCEGIEVKFINKSVDAHRFLWNFGDGYSSDEENPIHFYSKGGNFSVSLIAYNKYGCGAAQVKEKSISIDTLDFSASKHSICQNETVEFQGLGGFDNWQWDFGDGNISSERNPKHLYEKAGLYKVTLTATDQKGCSHTLVKAGFVQVNALPSVGIKISESIVCDNRKVEFQAVAGTEMGILWKFDDGYVSTDRVFKRSFETLGVYPVQVTFVNDKGCRNEKRFENAVELKAPVTTTIESSPLTGCAPLKVDLKNTSTGVDKVVWTINNQNLNGKSVSPVFDKAGEYAIKVSTVFTNGCVVEYSHPEKIVVHNTTNALSITQLEGCAPLSTHMSLKDKQVSEVVWRVGEKIEAGDPEMQFILTEAGTYPIKVSYTDKFGCRDSLVFAQQIKVLDTLLAYQAPPVINTCSYSKVDFYGGMGKDYWQWDFGDGQTSSAMNPSHVYSEPGRYIVSLKTKNKNGCATTIPVYNEINFSDLQVDINYTVTTAESCPEYSARFGIINNNEIRNATWQFGDYAVSKELSPVMDFLGNNEVSIKLTVQDVYGCTKSKVSIMKSPWPYCVVLTDDEDEEEKEKDIRTVTYHTINSCTAPFEVSFSDPWPSASSVKWFFGDGHSSTLREPKHVFRTPGIYKVDYQAEFQGGEKGEIKGYITVIINKPAIDFTYQTQISCNGIQANFEPVSSSFSNYNWVFSNGTQSKEFEVSSFYPHDRVDQIVLSGIDSAGCKATAVKNVAIGNPHNKFDFVKNICLGDSILFKHNIEGFSHYRWVFGDGTHSDATFPKHRFIAAGDFQVHMEATDYAGCVRTFMLPELVTVNNPIPEFDANTKYGCNSLTVNFRNESTGATHYLWDLGNGQTSTAANPRITYSPGQYHITLKASRNGCENVITKEAFITVDVLAADFTFVQENSCLPGHVAFSENSVNAEKWSWDFGDGKTSSQRNPVHQFLKHPSKNVVLKVENHKGCAVTRSKAVSFFQSDFSVINDEGCYPFATSFEEKSAGAISWLWDFGDGTISTDRNPSHMYRQEGEYTVSLQAKAADGCVETTVKEKLVKVRHIKADFTAQIDESICAPLVVVFTNQSEGATDFKWVFGDGAGSTLKNPFHVYNKVGMFDVKLVATNKIGCADTLVKKEFITTSGPETNFVISDTVVCNPKQLTFTDKSVSPVSWLWYFGDGHISTEQHVVHQYENPGIYSVTLATVDSKGCRQILSFDSLKVHLQPQANFDLDISGTCLPVVVNTRNISKALMDGAMFQWDFGNGEKYGDFAPEMVYEKPGSFPITLTVTNKSVCTHTFRYPVDIVVMDAFKSIEPEVVQLTVSDDNHVVIDYQTEKGNSFKYHVLYRKTNDGLFVALDTLRDINGSQYVDSLVIPSMDDYHYRIQTHSHCRVESPLGLLTNYRPIRLSKEARGLRTVLHWNGYEGHDFRQYVVQRREHGSTWRDIAQLEPGNSQYMDVELCPGQYLYRVVAQNLNGKDRHSTSSLIYETVVTDYSAQKVELVRSTVLEDGRVLTEWGTPNFGSNNVSSFEIFRSADGGNFRRIDMVAGAIYSYIDRMVDTRQEQYTYRIEIKNTCNTKATTSNIGTSILLQKETDYYRNSLKWTPYEGWGQGVKNYLLQHQDEFGEWKTIREFGEDERNTEIDLE